jgi:hypothetical protein
VSGRLTARPHASAAPTFLAPARAATLQRQCACGQHSSGAGTCASCQKQSRSQGLDHTGARDGALAPPIVSAELRTAGHPLDPGTRRLMESRFGHDFSGVRVHDSDHAAASTAAVNALAYTVGNDVVFNRGRYAPGTTAGNRLLAHELAHVVQQSSARASSLAPQRLRVGEPGDHHEREADAASEAVALGQEAPAPGSAPPSVVQRQPAPGAPPKPPAPAPPPRPPRDTHQPAPSTDVVEPTTHSASNYGLGIFESELRSFGAGSPCMLTLRLNLFFNFIDAPPPAPVTRNLWSAAEQNSWTNSFVRSVTSRWSYRYPLVVTDPKNCKWNKCTRAMPRVEVIPVPAAGNPDATINIAHVPASAYRSHAGYGGATLTREDINLGAHTPKQVTVEHEFGHLLGLDHSNPACQSTDVKRFQGNPSQENCYVGSAEQTEDIMGQGSVVTPQDYRPFVQEMNYYTKCTWQTEGSAPKPPGKVTGGHAGLVIFGILGGLFGGLFGGVLGGQPGGIGTGWGIAAGVALGGLAGAGVGAILDWARD